MHEDFLGPAVYLDQSLGKVLEVYWVLRRGTPSEQGIPISLRDLSEYDPTFLGLLMAADSGFLEEAAKARKEIENDRKAAKEKLAASVKGK